MIYKSALKSVKKTGKFKWIKTLKNWKKSIFYHYPSIDLQGESILSPRRLTYKWWRFLRERSFYTHEIKKGERKINLIDIQSILLSILLIHSLRVLWILSIFSLILLISILNKIDIDNLRIERNINNFVNRYSIPIPSSTV